MNYYNSFIQYYKKHQDQINISVLVTLCIIAFFNVLSGYFIEVDDFSSILHRKRDFLNILFTNTKGSHSGGNYRPIESLSHIIDTILFGNDNTLGRRLVNLSIHFINVTLVYYIVKHVSKKSVIALIAALIYSVHFIHSRSLPPVGWITGRSELTLTLFYLLSIFLYSKALVKGSNLIYLLSLISFFFSLLSKELAVSLPIIVFIYTLLFPEFRKTKGIFNLPESNLIFKTSIGFGVLLLAAGIVLSPGVLSFFSSDSTLQASTEKFISTLRLIAVSSGLLLIGGAFAFNYLLKWMQIKFRSINSLWYIVPFFFVFAFFMILRRLIIGGFGGAYQSEGGNLFLELGPDSFIRDLYSLASLIWPISTDYHLKIFELQIENPFMFYFFGSLIMILLIYIVYNIIKTRNRLLLFGILWLFIIAIPAHNIMINPWQTQSRYLYLPLFGFCLFVSVIFYNFIQKNQSRLLRVSLIAAFIGVVIFKVYSVISYNSKLVEGSRYMKTFVTDMKKYKPLINDSTSFYFINFPSSEINTPSNIYITAYMNDLLNYIDNYDGYSKKYNYNMLFFVKGEEQNTLNIKWNNKNSLIIDGINPEKYFLLPKDYSNLDLKIKNIYKRTPYHPIRVPLSDISSSKLKSAIVIKLINTHHQREYRVDLNKEAPNENRLVFIYERGHFRLASQTPNAGLHPKLACNL